MYKSKLHELCSKKAWPRPIYSVNRHGPAHNARFRANVLVNGISFDADDLSRSSKEAQNKVSQVAFEHFAPALLESSSPSTGATRSNLSFRRELREYAVKNSLDVPTYTYSWEGPAHALRFKADVKVGGETYHSTTSSSKLREAGNDAAKAALMVLTAKETSNAKNDSVSDKSLLNDFAQKANISMPSYKTSRCNGVDGFSCTVDVGNSSFCGDVAKSERQAEDNPRKRKCPMVEEEVRKLNIFNPSKELKFGEEAEALEENLREKKVSVAELKLKRKNLERETMELLLKGNK